MSYLCKDCGWDIFKWLCPPLSHRGLTKAEAVCIFVDGTGGRCAGCYIKHRSAESVALCRKLSGK